MRVLQFTKRSVTLLAAVCVALSGCGDSGPEAPFNPTGTSEDIQALNATFDSPTFTSFTTLSPLFDATLGGAPLVSTSASAFNLRRNTSSGELRAAAERTARRVAARASPATSEGALGVTSAAIPAEFAGKTFEYNGGSYVVTDRTGAPSNGVRFLLYAINPVTFQPVQPLQEVGYVELTDLSGSSSQGARVVVVSEGTTYLDYTVTVTATTTSGRITVAGFVSNGAIRANINLRTTVTSAAGLTLVYAVSVPERDVAISLTLTASGLDQETATIDLSLTMSGPNGGITMVGQFTQTGGTLTVSVNGETFATITSTGGGAPVITGSGGEPLTDEDIAALQGIFELTNQAFISFEIMLLPVGFFLAPAA
jgi:hypothetical protein